MDFLIGDEHLRAMGLGLSGSHRTGKTVTAQKLAESNASPFVASSASAVAKAMGITVDAGMDMEERMLFQETVLSVFEKQYSEQYGLFFTDRTPIDMAAYALCDWRPDKSTPELDKRLEDYVDRCLEVTQKYFYMVGVIQPGIPYVADEGKPAPNDMYQEILNNMVIGLVMKPEFKSAVTVMPRVVTNLTDRINYFATAYGEYFKEYKGFLEDTMTLQ